MIELGFDRRDVFLFRPELQRPAPLIARFGQPAIAPIGVAEMIVDGRVGRHQFDRPFEILNGAGVVAHAIMCPTEAVHDVAVLGAQLDRLLDHF